MPQSQIIRSPADVSDLQTSGRLDTSEPSAVRRVTMFKTSVTNRHRSPSDQRPTFFPLIGLAPADDRTHIGSFCSIGRSPD
ncbi:hypothetical protein DPMN_005813 [Dreissena polymorpha]|uniref:Uncharacterized protein n=1 Tax=Dreissena polymorpha TaxID=45954 RepID=A0A9D4MSW7_DREPO|nr:hypothetical protein DPMN_005813 [Dreissena polymorpha]